MKGDVCSYFARILIAQSAPGGREPHRREVRPPEGGRGKAELICTDKFGQRISTRDAPRPPFDRWALRPRREQLIPIDPEASVKALYRETIGRLPSWDYSDVLEFLEALIEGLTKIATGAGSWSCSRC